MKNKIKNLLPEPIKKILRRAKDLIDRLLFGFTKEVILTDNFGIRFILSPYQRTHIRWLIIRGAYLKEWEAMQQIIKPNDVVFDIGANVGIVSIFLANKVRDGKVYSFEPHPVTFEKLKETVALNHKNNVFPQCIAISDKNDTAPFYFEDDARSELNSLGKVTMNGKLPTKSINVRTETLDSFCEQNKIDTINFLKIDVEGCEEMVLMGAVKMLSQNKIENIQFEISREPLQSLGRNSSTILDILRKYNYKISRYDQVNKIFVEIKEINDNNYDNYYASKN